MRCPCIELVGWQEAPIVREGQSCQERFRENERFQFRVIRELGAAAPGRFHDDMHVAIFCKRWQVDEIRHGGGLHGCCSVRRQRRKCRTDAIGSPLSFKVCYWGETMLEYGLRFLAGGIAVSAFAALGDTLRPKSFAGLFGAAPSIALATLLITLTQNGAAFAAVEGRSMIVGAFALAAYSWTVCVLLNKFLMSSWTATMAALLVWFVVSFCIF